MKQELQNKLFSKYPEIFKQKTLSPKHSLMCFGIECGDGWYGIINWLCSRLKRSGNVEAVQVKEKFGGLRFYVGEATDSQFEDINRAEDLSFFICEKCGSPFDVEQTKGWVTTLCGKCREGRNNK